MSANINDTVYNWLKEMKIPASKTYLLQQLNSHPDFPSMLSITDTLSELGIENAAIQIEKEQLYKLPVPIIAHLNSKGGEFLMIKNHENLNEQFPDFFNRWGGVVIVGEKPMNWSHSENEEYLEREKKQTRINSLAVISLIVLSGWAVAISFSWIIFGMMLVALAGIFVSWMIVSKELGIENKVADQVCGGEADCNEVVQSKGAKIPLGISLSDVGVIWFMSLTLILITGSFTNNTIPVIGILSLFAVSAVPFTFFSIYYQWRVLKKWCRLCLMTVGLLWIQIFILLPEVLNLINNGMQLFSVGIITLIIALLVIVSVVWLVVKPMIIENKKHESEIITAKRFKRNEDLFIALLEKQKKVEIKSDGLGITLGNPEATNTIIKVCNPYCGPCIQAHPVIEELLEKNKNVKVQIIFTAKNDENDIKAKPVKHLMALYEKGNGQLIKTALDDWYLADKKDYEAFAGKYQLNGELEKQGKKLDAMKEWCDEVKISFTPTFFVNGYQLPRQYQVDELKYFL